MRPFRTTRRVEFADTDMAGIIHFTAFFRYMEEAEHAFLRSLGLSVVMDWEGQSLGFPRVSASCDFVSPARFEDVLDVDVTLARIGTKSLTYEIAFSLRGAPIASGKLSAVCCKMRPGGIDAVAVPEELRQRLLGGPA
jgi:4-hydroxybenzoyl-CoA thioesterase/acyl-CoA thioester hydrolase